jgi:hypothetical protein
VIDGPTGTGAVWERLWRGERLLLRHWRGGFEPVIQSGFELRQFLEVLTEARVLGFDLFAELPESCVDLVGRGWVARSGGLSGMMVTAFAILSRRCFNGLLLAALLLVGAAAFLVFRRVLAGVLVIVAAPL